MINNRDSIIYNYLIGDSGSGKTSFSNKYINDEFSLECKTTVGASYLARNIKLEDKIIKAQIWDASGGEKSSTSAKLFYSGAAGALILYDITNPATCVNIEKWLKELNAYNSQMLKILVGNKSDLKYLRMIKSEDAQRFAQMHNILFIETSALDGLNIDEAVYLLVKGINIDIS